MNKAFPQLQNTNLVAASLENLKNKTLGVDRAFKSLVATSSQVDMALAKVQAAGKLDFSKMTGKAVFKDLANTMRDIKSGTGASFEQIGASLRKMGVDGQYVRGAMSELNKEMTGFRHGIDVVRTALGTLTAIGIFQFISLLTESFQGATKAARELEDSMFRLANVERILSEGGVETSMVGLKKGISDIKKILPIFSKEDITQTVAQVAIATKELGYTEKQIIDITKALGVMNIRSTQEETLAQSAPPAST